MHSAVLHFSEDWTRHVQHNITVQYVVSSEFSNLMADTA